MTVLCNTSMFADDFKPASIDTSKPAVIDIEEGNKVKVTVPHVEVCWLEWQLFDAHLAPLVSQILGPRDSRSSLLSIVISTDPPSYTVVDCRRPSFASRCCPCLERTTTPHHACTVPFTSFPDSHPNTYFQLFFSRLSVVPVNLLVSLLVTLITFVTYFFTYLRSFKSISTSVMAYPVTNQEYCKVHLSANNGEFARADKFSVDAGMRQQMILSV